MDPTEVRRAWDTVAETYASRRDPDGSDAALIDDLLDELPSDPTVLDVGCGDGARTLANLPADSVGLDVSRRGLALAAEETPHARLVQGDLATLPLAADTVDAVTAYHAVFHVSRDRHPTVYDGFARVLRPGGRLLATVGSRPYETIQHDWLGSGQSMFFSTAGRRRTRSGLETAGFAIVWERVVDDPLGSSVPFVLAEYQG